MYTLNKVFSNRPTKQIFTRTSSLLDYMTISTRGRLILCFGGIRGDMLLNEHSFWQLWYDQTASDVSQPPHGHCISVNLRWLSLSSTNTDQYLWPRWEASSSPRHPRKSLTSCLCIVLKWSRTHFTVLRHNTYISSETLGPIFADLPGQVTSKVRIL